MAPRAAILATKDVAATALDNLCNRDCAAALVKLHGQQILIASIYLDIRKNVTPDWLLKITNTAASKGWPLILGIDTNAHSSLYGPDNNPRGDDLEDFILTHSLTVENEGNVPTYEAQRGNSVASSYIDVTLSRDLPFDILDWKVSREYNASDHNTISFNIRQTPRTKRKIRPWSKANWESFKQVLRDADYAVPNSISMKKLDNLLNKLYAHLNRAINSACPEIEVDDQVPGSHWATTAHDTEKKRVSTLYRQARTTKTTQAWNAYREADKAFKKMCKKDKNQAWRKYIESLQSTKDMASLARLAQRKERRDIDTLTKPDGTITDPGQGTISLLTATHFPAATDPVRVRYNNRRNCTVAELEDKYQDWISPQLIRRALDGFEKKKSPGPDNIKPLVFEHLPAEFLTTLQVAYKAAIHLGYTPKLWKETKVIYISKPGKEDYSKPKSYRPISLSNYFLKGLERLVVWNMDRALIDYPIHHKQHGFLTGKSTESAISNTTDYIEKYIMRKQHCVGVFLDISSAFDSIRPNHVRRALLDHGGHPEMVQWYHNYITHRNIQVTMHGETVTFSTGIGFPQGGVCSAKFWLIAFDFAIKIINTYNIEGNGYADDCSALYGGPRLDHAISRLQKMLDSLTAWGKRCGLHFNPEKSVAVVFTRRRKTPPRALKIDGKEIPYKQEVNYLGVTLDSKLLWNTHINNKITKAKRFISNVADITRKNWGPKPKLMRWAYLGMVRPMICYASMVWGHRAPHAENKLRRLNRMAINTFGSFPKSTPTRALEIILDVMPLHLFCLQEAIASRSRLHDVVKLDWPGTNQKKTHSISHLRFLEDHMTKLALDPANLDTCSQLIWSSGYHINRDSFSGAAKQNTFAVQRLHRRQPHRQPYRCGLHHI